MGAARVAVVRCDSYDPSDVSSAVLRLFDLLGGPENLLPGCNSVLIKPNMLSPSDPSLAVTTHPEVVAAVARLLKDRGKCVLVGDGPGRGDVFRVAAQCGIKDACERAAATLVSFDEAVAVKNPRGRICKEFTISRAVLDADAVVNVAKMKTHGFMGFTGAVKNMFGCIPGTRKAAMHLRYQEPREFALMLLDLLSVTMPRVSVLDAITAMDDEGPSHGRPRHIGALLASTDPVALDATALRMVGVEPRIVPYLALAGQLGIGTIEPDSIELVGDDLSGFYVPDFQMPSSQRPPRSVLRVSGRLRRFLTAVPCIDVNKCTGCGQCAASCPPRAVRVGTEGKAIIDRRSCIHCYCCHEMCPRGAVYFKKGTLARLTDRVLEFFDR